MATYQIYDKRVIFADKDGGAVLLDDELWWPFAFFSDGNMDIWDTEGGYYKPSSAYKMAKLKFT